MQPPSGAVAIPPQPSFQPDRSPPWGIWIGPGEFLVVDGFSFLTSASVTIGLRFILPDGRLHTERFTYGASSSQTRQTQYYPLPEGCLIGCSVNTYGTAFHHGSAFVNIGIQIGEAAAGQVHTQLLAAHLVNNRALTWPASQTESSAEGTGALFQLSSADPSAGSELSYTAGASQLTHIISGAVSLVTSATVATRTVVFTIDDGSTIVWQSGGATDQAASLTYTYVLSESGAMGNSNGNVFRVPLPPGLRLQPNWRLRTITTNLQAGDDYSPLKMLAELWLWS